MKYLLGGYRARMSDGDLHLIYADYLIRSRVSRCKSVVMTLMRGISGMDFGHGIFVLCSIVDYADTVDCNAVNANNNFCMMIKKKI
jgi:hypothetical protein